MTTNYDVSYVRLFLRKASTWHRVKKLGYYNDIADMDTAVIELQTSRSSPSGNEYTFADSSKGNITTLEDASALLLLDELKTVAKEAKVQGKNKTELLHAFRRTSKRQSGLGFLKRSDTNESITSVESESDSGASTPQSRDAYYLDKIMAETGLCIRLSSEVRMLFDRVHHVFYRSTEWTEKSLTTIILARISRWTFPKYLVSRSTNIFASRDILIEFETAIRTQFRVDNILEFNGTPTKDTMHTVLEIFDEIYPRWRVLLKEEQLKEDTVYAGEGAYLRRFNPAWVYTRIVHKSAFVLGRFKQHLREHTILTELLDQKLFHTSRRGDWYQRRALLEEHYMYALKPNEGRSEEVQKRHWKRISLQTCETGLEDPLTHLIYHYDLQKRVMKLEKALRIPKRIQHDFSHVRLAKPVERTFYGTQIITENSTSTKTVWVDPALPTSTCSVESMCLSKYRSLGWKGYHCESSLIRTLFAALFHDVLFTYVPNVFQTEYQTCPLDLHTDTFYPCRLSEVNMLLNDIANGKAREIVEAFYNKHEVTRTCVVGFDWSFDKMDILTIVDCWSTEGLSAVMKVLAQEYANRGGGVPDLFLWMEFDPVTFQAVGADESSIDDKEIQRRKDIISRGQKGEIMFSEVKSVNDRLSDTQRMWIDVLTGAGIRVELCHAYNIMKRTTK